MIYAIGILLSVSIAQSWFLWRLSLRLRSLPRLDERVAALTHSLGLLTDATESCFNTIALQLESPARATRARPARQRRVVSAARNGQSVTAIAAEEELAETEVRLRLHLAEQAGRPRETAHDAPRS